MKNNELRQQLISHHHKLMVKNNKCKIGDSSYVLNVKESNLCESLIVILDDLKPSAVTRISIEEFFKMFPIKITPFAKRCGINTSQMRQYASGAKIPSAKTLEIINKNIKTIAEELSSAKFDL